MFFNSFLAQLFNILVEVDDVMLILLIHQRRGNHKIGSRFIVGDRDIVNLGDSKKRLEHPVRCGRAVRGSEKKMIKSTCPRRLLHRLLVAAQRTAVIALDRKPGIFRNHAGGCAGSA